MVAEDSLAGRPANHRIGSGSGNLDAPERVCGCEARATNQPPIFFYLVLEVRVVHASRRNRAHALFLPFRPNYSAEMRAPHELQAQDKKNFRQFLAPIKNARP